MTTRKQFLTAVAAGTAVAAAPSATAAAVASSGAKAAPTPTPVSPAARAWAERMRAFDSHLTDSQVDAIATGIDDEYAWGKRVDPRGSKLKNGDEPAPAFGADR